MFKAPLSLISKKWKKSKCPSAAEQIKNMWYTVNLAINRNDVEIHAASLMNLDNIMLSDRSQSQKKMCRVIPFI